MHCRFSEEGALKPVKVRAIVGRINPKLEKAGRYLCYNAMRESQSASREKLSALMPFVLDRAFKGAL